MRNNSTQGQPRPYPGETSIQRVGTRPSPCPPRAPRGRHVRSLTANHGEPKPLLKGSVLPESRCSQAPHQTRAPPAVGVPGTTSVQRAITDAHGHLRHVRLLVPMRLLAEVRGFSAVVDPTGWRTRDVAGKSWHIFGPQRPVGKGVISYLSLRASWEDVVPGYIPRHDRRPRARQSARAPASVHRGIALRNTMASSSRTCSSPLRTPEYPDEIYVVQLKVSGVIRP